MTIKIPPERAEDKYLTQDLGEGGQVKVDLYNGNLKYYYIDMQYNYGNPPIVIGHAFSNKNDNVLSLDENGNVDASTYSRYGNRWGLSSGEAIRLYNEGSEILYYSSTHGSSFYSKVKPALKQVFMKRITEDFNNNTNVFISEDDDIGFFYTVGSGTNTEFVYATVNGTFKYYSKQGWLKKETNKKEQSVYYNRDATTGLLLSVYDEEANSSAGQQGRKFTVNYTKNGSAYLNCISIEDNTGKRVKYNYDDANNLSSIVKVSQNGEEKTVATFSYNEYSLLTRVENEHGLVYAYTYNNNGQVETISTYSTYERISNDGVTHTTIIPSMKTDTLEYRIHGNTPRFTTLKLHTGRQFLYYYYSSTSSKGASYEIGTDGKVKCKDYSYEEGDLSVSLKVTQENMVSNPTFINSQVDTNGNNVPESWVCEDSLLTNHNYMKYSTPDTSCNIILPPRRDSSVSAIAQTIANISAETALGTKRYKFSSGIYNFLIDIPNANYETLVDVRVNLYYEGGHLEPARFIDSRGYTYNTHYINSVYINDTYIDEEGVSHELSNVKLEIYNIKETNLEISYVYFGKNDSTYDFESCAFMVLNDDGTTYEEEIDNDTKKKVYYPFNQVSYYNNWLWNDMYRLKSVIKNAYLDKGTVDPSTLIAFNNGMTYSLDELYPIFKGYHKMDNSNIRHVTEYDEYKNPIKQNIWNQNLCDQLQPFNEENKAFQVLATYDNLNRLTKMTDYRNITHEIIYSADDVVPKTETHKIYYNDSYKMQTSKTMTDNGYAVASETDELGRVTQYVYKTGEDEPLAQDKLYMVIYPNNLYCRYEYDNFDKVTKLAMGKKTVDENGADVFTDEHFYTYEYTLGLLTKVTTDAGVVYTYDYNGMNQILNVKRNNVELVRYEYHITYGENYENYMDTIKLGKTYRTYFDKYDKPIKTCEIAVQETVLTEITYDEDTEECLQITDTVNNTIIEGNTTWSFDSTENEATVEASGITNYKHKDYYNAGKLMETEQETENATLYSKYNYVEDVDKGLYPDNRLRSVEYKGKTKVTAKNNSTNEETVTNGLNDLGKLTYNYNLLQQQTSDVMQLDENSGYHNVYRTNRIYKTANNNKTNVVEEWNNYIMPPNATAESSLLDKYSYDDAGNITQIRRRYIKDNNETVDDIRYKYRYDNSGKLIREDNSYFNETITYEYDTRGNIIKQTKYDYSSGDELQGTPVEKVYTYDENNRMLTMGDFVCTYDEHGRPKRFDYKYNIGWDGSRMIRCSNKVFAYDNRGYLVKARYGTTIQYFTYDANGNLIEEKINDAGNEEKITYFYSDKNEVLGFTLKKITTTTDSTTNVTTTTEEDYPFYYIKDMQGNINYIVDKNSNLVVKYYYDAWGFPFMVSDSNYQVNLGNGRVYYAGHIVNFNRFYYRSYFLDYDTGLYYLKSRFYDPKAHRFLSPDDTKYLDPQTPYGTNLYAYCGNDPVNHIDPSGHAWYHWAIGAGIIVLCAALTVVTAGGFAAAGTAFASVVSATMAPTALSAVFAGATIGAAAIGTAGMVIGGMSGEDGWSWENASQGFMAGSIAGAVIGGAWGGAHYALQSAGKMAIRTNINNLVNNPLDEFVTVGPKDGGISGYVRSISQTGDYGQIFASKLPNGMYQIADGHHRVAALRQLGYRYVNFFLVP
ncbi:MAG: hypothetical protein J6C23_05435 [Clostridia bacterium]|nr:hypothetical protein [Clostridia bacterium]